MSRLSRIRLTELSRKVLSAKEQNVLIGGGSCPTDCGTCGCIWEGYPGGSGTNDNQRANLAGHLYSPCVDDYEPEC